MDLSVMIQFAGGIGLFLLGMRLMTDGVKVAAGTGLRSLLAFGTTTRVRAVASGAAITSLVQSSSAVTFATIGFVNAGLLALPQAVGVIYGANLGTTVTSWLVALIGLKLDVRILALPLIAAGMGIRVAFGSSRRGSFGEALAGLGVFFLGIETLKEAFDGIGIDVAPGPVAGGLTHTVSLVGVGFLLTVIMQSSSATLVLSLSAVSAGTVPLAAGAALVVGANLGTTTTAAIAAIGATSAAKRAAAMHVVFNVVVAVLALLVMPVSLAVFGWFGFGAAVVLALFHTTINVLGLVAIWPVTDSLIAFVERRFRTAEDDVARPRHLDSNIATTPDLALNALVHELERARGLARTLALATISGPASSSVPARGRDALDRLIEAIGEFVTSVARGESGADGFSRVLRVNQYLADIAERCVEYLEYDIDARVLDAAGLERSLHTLTEHAAAALAESAEDGGAAAAFESAYQASKAALLRAGVERTIPVRAMTANLDRISALRRLVDQWTKASRHLEGLRAAVTFTRP